MTTDTPDTVSLDQATAEALAAEFHRCFTDFTARVDLFAPDAFYDLLPPMWRFQLEGPGTLFCEQLRSISDGATVEVEVLRTLPTPIGFVTEHIETQHTPGGDMVARRIHVCEVGAGCITAVTTYCNGAWDDALRARQAVEAPMIRP